MARVGVICEICQRKRDMTKKTVVVKPVRSYHVLSPAQVAFRSTSISVDIAQDIFEKDTEDEKANEELQPQKSVPCRLLADTILQRLVENLILKQIMAGDIPV
ncbi:unnamed protein product [Didymodactylos carnosus]|uniref:Uncharacterized protein n=2 Tax=Didymodactylos carnosus TaxID=1234261 RepID=A0A8S2DAL8_9BILA|nr:unnamed protein product [Didymodactylos carnosus]CAF3699401.1 unnamed protein product [Didymodactylos carnosus]